MQKLVTIVSPFYNEGENIVAHIKEIKSVISTLEQYNVAIYELLLIDDGSDILLDVVQLQQEISDDFLVRIIRLTRNFGKENAILAGLENITDNVDAVILMDSDLQHPVSSISEFIEYWQQGYDVVYAYKQNRADEAMPKRLLVHLYYKMMQLITDSDFQKDASDFRLMSYRVVQSFLSLEERMRFSKGLFAWIGFKQKAIPYVPAKRNFGKTSFSPMKLFSFGIMGAVSFSTKPLRLASILGFILALFSFGFLIFTVLEKLLFGNPVAGYPTLLSIILLVSAVQFIFIGILGEYISQIHMEVKHRPHYLIAEERLLNDKTSS